MKVLTEPSSYAQTSSGTVWGTVWFELADHAFPESRWSDMVLAVLRGWLESIDDLMRKDIDQSRLFFMDGPFEIHVLKQENGLWKLAFFKRGQDRVYDVVEIQPLEFLAMILRAASIAIEACAEKQFESKDFRVLKALVLQLNEKK